MIIFKDFIRKVKWWDEIDGIYQWYLTNVIHEIIDNINNEDYYDKDINIIKDDIKNNLISWINK